MAKKGVCVKFSLFFILIFNLGCAQYKTNSGRKISSEKNVNESVLTSEKVVEIIYSQGEKIIEPRTGMSVRKLFHETLFTAAPREKCIDFVRLRPSIYCTQDTKKGTCKVTISTDQFIALVLDKETKDKRSGLKVSSLGAPESLALDDFLSFDLTIQIDQANSLKLEKVDNFTSAGGGTEYGETCLAD